MNEKKFYVTTPIYYPSNNLHLGNAYTTIVADCLKRYKRQRGFDTIMITGTDEHGQKIQSISSNKGQSPMEYIEPIVDNAKTLWKKLNIDYDNFIRTTDQIHEKNVVEIFNKLYKKGDIYKDKYKGKYCVPCESFWTESQLIEKKYCPDCGRQVIDSEEESYFFKLSKYKEKIIEVIENNPEYIQPESSRNEMISFLKEGLNDLSITRSSFNWGIKVPFDTNHVIYVWIDALSCYLTGAGYGVDKKKFEKFWPCDIHLVGKEIMRFHAIIWTAILLALDLPLPKKIFGHGWILFDEKKMSKSRGNVLYAEPLIERYGTDSIRYFMLREFVFGQDGSFNYYNFLNRINSDLVNDLGNLVSRTITMCEKYFNGEVPESGELFDIDKDLIKMAEDTFKIVETNINSLNFSEALENIWKFIRRTNKYVDQTSPWILAKADKNRLKTVIYNLIESIRAISDLIQAFIPNTALKINEQIGYCNNYNKKVDIFGILKAGTKIKRDGNLFDRIDLKKELKYYDKYN